MMNIEQFKKDAYGEKIKLLAANEMIKEFSDLDKLIEKSVNQNEPDSNKRGKAEVLKGRSCNAFVFHRKLIERFFDGSEVDPAGKPVQADYLVVFLGAHSKPVKDPDDPTKIRFQAGSFTVITMGCKLDAETQNERDVPKLYPIKTMNDDPGNEYPPGYSITKLEYKQDPGDRSIGYFVFK